MKESPGIALITGSGRRRVGNVVARALAEQGYSIALHYHSSEEAARESVEELRGLGIDSESYQANVAAESDVDAMFDQIIERFGRIDVLVTTASVWETGRLEEVSAEDLLRNFNVNTLGTFLCARRAGLAMCQQDEGGSIITIGDWAIDRPYIDHAAYFLSKGAIPTLTRTLPVGSCSAICRDIASMPFAGRTASPVANIRNTNSNMRLDVTSSGSRKTPPQDWSKERLDDLRREASTAKRLDRGTFRSLEQGFE